MPVAGSRSFVQTSAADDALGDHSCGVAPDGTGYCWGANGSGEIGDGTTERRSVPTAVQSEADFVAIDAGRTHSCGLTANATILCWGANSTGQLGDGTTTDSMTPVAVASAEAFVELGVGSRHSCGRTGDGRILGWGSNGKGQLGVGAGITSSLDPAEVAGGLLFTDLAVGNDHSCGVTTTAEMYCWGENISGQIGTGGTSGAEPEPVLVPGPPGSD